MKKEVAEKWVAALRSDEYTQSRSYLRRTDDDHAGFCCLGVLCDISGVGKWEERSGLAMYYHTQAGTDDVSLPYGVKDWAGVRDSYGMRLGHNKALSGLNDDGVSFEEIADIIEKEWESL